MFVLLRSRMTDEGSLEDFYVNVEEVETLRVDYERRRVLLQLTSREELTVECESEGEFQGLVQQLLEE